MWSLDIWKNEMVLRILQRHFEKNVIVVNQMWIIQYYYSLHVDLTDSSSINVLFVAYSVQTFSSQVQFE